MQPAEIVSSFSFAVLSEAHFYLFSFDNRSPTDCLSVLQRRMKDLHAIARFAALYVRLQLHAFRPIGSHLSGTAMQFREFAIPALRRTVALTRAAADCTAQSLLRHLVLRFLWLACKNLKPWFSSVGYLRHHPVCATMMTQYATSLLLLAT